MEFGEHRLLALGCTKLNFQIRHGNEQAEKFYERVGYKADAVVSFGKRSINDSMPKGTV